MNKVLTYFTGACLLLLVGMLFQSATPEASSSADQVVIPTATTINQTDSVAYMTINTRELKLDYKSTWHLELVENSGTVTSTVTLQGSNFDPDSNLWEDVATWSVSATGDTTMTYDGDSPSYSFWRIKTEKATNSGNYSVTLNAGVKLNAAK